MWTISNSRGSDSWRFVGALLVAAGCGCASARQSIAPDAPRPPRLDVTTVAAGSGGAEQGTVTVELASVSLRRVGADTLLRRLAGAELLRRATNPVAIDVTTAQPLGNVDRTSSLEIYLDSVRVGDTWALPPNRLVAFVSDAQRLREGVAVTVAWLGDEQRTRSRRPIVLTVDHMRAIR